MFKANKKDTGTISSNRLYQINWFTSRPYQKSDQNSELLYKLKFEVYEFGLVHLDELVHFTRPHLFIRESYK